MADERDARRIRALIRETGTRLDLLIARLSVEEMNRPGVVGVWSVKDVLAHLAYWQRYAADILRAAADGSTPDLVGDDATERFNASVVKQYYQRPLSRVIAEWHAAREELIDLLEDVSDEDLTDPTRFPWSGGRALLDHIAGSSYAHEQEHIQQIGEWMRSL